MVDVKSITKFLEVATDIFPLEGKQHHNLILSDDGKLTAMILINDINEWWYCTPDTDDEWINAEETLATLKKAAEDANKED